MQMDPKVAIWLNIAYQILTGVTATMLSSFGVADASHVVAICESLAGVINIVLHAFSSSTPGPLASNTK
jgi:hypothetical protein